MKINEKITAPDQYVLTVADHDTLARILEWYLRRPLPMEWYVEAVKNPTEKIARWITQAVRNAPEHLLEFCQQKTYTNIVPSVLRYELASLISGNTVTPTFKANYFALGTGSSVPANGDLTLQTETLRALFTDRSYYQNVAYLDVFFPSASVGGNSYTEAGIFVDGSGSANSGYLLSRTAINQILGSNQTLTVNGSITVS